MLAISAWADHLGLDLQAVARAFDLLNARQFAYRRIQQVEGLAGLERDFDQALLAIVEGFAGDFAGDQLDPCLLYTSARCRGRCRRGRCRQSLSG